MGRASNLGSRALVDLRPGKDAFPALRVSLPGEDRLQGTSSTSSSSLEAALPQHQFIIIGKKDMLTL